MMSEKYKLGLYASLSYLFAIGATALMYFNFQGQDLLPNALIIVSLLITLYFTRQASKHLGSIKTLLSLRILFFISFIVLVAYGLGVGFFLTGNLQDIANLSVLNFQTILFYSGLTLIGLIFLSWTSTFGYKMVEHLVYGIQDVRDIEMSLISIDSVLKSLEGKLDQYFKKNPKKVRTFLLEKILAIVKTELGECQENYSGSLKEKQSYNSSLSIGSSDFINYVHKELSGKFGNIFIEGLDNNLREFIVENLCDSLQDSSMIKSDSIKLLVLEDYPKLIISQGKIKINITMEEISSLIDGESIQTHAFFQEQSSHDLDFFVKFKRIFSKEYPKNKEEYALSIILSSKTIDDIEYPIDGCKLEVDQNTKKITLQYPKSFDKNDTTIRAVKKIESMIKIQFIESTEFRLKTKSVKDTNIQSSHDDEINNGPTVII